MDSVAVVTGAAGDIGQRIAARLAETHNHVVLVDINEPGLRAVVSALNRDNLSTLVCDVTDFEAVTKMAQSAASLGRIRTLVNNAGATKVDSLREMDFPAWRREMALNLDAAFACFHAFQDALIKTQGTVINIASVNGMSVLGNPAYSAAKAGLIHLTQSIAVEYGQYGVRANAVAPGTVRTQAWNTRVQSNPSIFDEVMQWYPLQRVIEPDDIANAVVFLASDQAAAITGVCLLVDGGLLAGQAAIARSFSQSPCY